MRKTNGKLLKEWVLSNGENEAVAQIMKKTGLQFSTIDKLLRDKYYSQPGYTVRQALVELTHIDEDKLFPRAPTRGKAS